MDDVVVLEICRVRLQGSRSKGIMGSVVSSLYERKSESLTRAFSDCSHRVLAQDLPPLQSDWSSLIFAPAAPEHLTENKDWNVPPLFTQRSKASSVYVGV